MRYRSKRYKVDAQKAVKEPLNLDEAIKAENICQH